MLCYIKEHGKMEGFPKGCSQSTEKCLSSVPQSSVTHCLSFSMGDLISGTQSYLFY
jgi:hypothetical protein